MRNPPKAIPVPVIGNGWGMCAFSLRQLVTLSEPPVDFVAIAKEELADFPPPEGSLFALLTPEADEEQELMAAFAQSNWRMPFIVLSAVNDARRAVLALKQGATDYFPIMRAGCDTGIDLRVCLEALLLTAVPPPGVSSRSCTGLSARETECLALSARGGNTDTIAYQLGISERTVRFHVSNAMRKLGAASRTQAIVVAAKTGQLEL